MKFLLAAINAKYIHSNLGIYSLKAYAQKNGNGKEAFPVEIALGEYTINHSCSKILSSIFEKKPDIVGFSCYLWNMEYVRQIIYDLPKILPQVKIWLGGPEVSYCAEELMAEFPQLEGIMRGEGEEAFAGLIREYGYQAGREAENNPGKEKHEPEKDKPDGKEGKDERWKKIPGIVYRNQAGEVVSNPLGEPLNLSCIPFPYTQEWMKDLDLHHRIIYYESSRGCPFSCSYCLSSIDKRVRFRDLELVFRELQFFLDRKVAQVKFVDRTFNCRRSHSFAIWKYLLEHDNGVTNFHFEIGADLFNEEDLELLKRMRPGLIQLEIGVQTTNPQSIREIHRTMDLPYLETIVARIRQGKNIHQHLDLIAGLPYEDRESFRRSFDRVYRMKPDQLQLGFLKVLKGSLMEEQKKAYGLQFTAAPPYEVLGTKWLGYDDILHLKEIEEMVEVYYNSGQFYWTIHCLEKLFLRPVELFEALAHEYQEKHLQDVNHSRQARYAIIFAFVQQHFPEETETIRDSLTIDFYAREKAKTRPAFARDLRPYRETIQQFYQQEEKERKYLHSYREFDSRQLSRITHLEVLGDGRMVLFDYRNRDPRSYNARMVLCP